jgi:predicted phage tail protein
LRAFGAGRVPAVEVCVGSRLLQEEGVLTMLYGLAVVLFVLWLVAMGASYTLGGVIHVLLVLALISVLVKVIQGRAVLS